jgi:hypothetical protein
LIVERLPDTLEVKQGTHIEPYGRADQATVANMKMGDADKAILERRALAGEPEARFAVFVQAAADGEVTERLTRAEWDTIPDDYKCVLNKCHVLRLNRETGATVLVPVEVEGRR